MQDKDENKRFELRLLCNALERQVAVYEVMKNGEIPALPETKKATQNSIKEICAALSDCVSK